MAATRCDGARGRRGLPRWTRRGSSGPGRGRGTRLAAALAIGLARPIARGLQALGQAAGRAPVGIGALVEPHHVTPIAGIGAGAAGARPCRFGARAGGPRGAERQPEREGGDACARAHTPSDDRMITTRSRKPPTRTRTAATVLLLRSPSRSERR